MPLLLKPLELDQTQPHRRLHGLDIRLSCARSSSGLRLTLIQPSRVGESGCRRYVSRLRVQDGGGRTAHGHVQIVATGTRIIGLVAAGDLEGRALTERVPDESTVRKVVRGLGPETVNELVCRLIESAARERRFRPRAVRIDSTVVAADVRYPTDADLAAKGVKVLARDGARLGRLIREKRVRVRDRSRSMGIKLRLLGRTVKCRSGEAKSEVLALTEQTGRLLEASVNEARKLARVARQRARGRGAKAKVKAAARLEGLGDRCEKVASQIRRRVAGKPISDGIVSLADPDARPIRKGKLGKPNEFGYVS